MLTTGIFTVYGYAIPFKHYGKPIYIIPFGDVHRNSSQCHEEKWQEFLEWAKNKPNCYFLGMGDYLDTISTSERAILGRAKSDLHNETFDKIEAFMMKDVRSMVNELSFMRGKLIGMIEGNHYYEFKNGATSTMKMCEMLNCKYLGVSSFIRLSFQNNRFNMNCDMWAHHGKGAARLIGGSLNTVQQMAEAANASIYLMGHDHKKSVGMSDILELNSSQGNVRLHHRKRLYVRTGSFLRGYVDGRQSYVADRGLNPTNLGVVKVEVTPKATGHGKDCRKELDIHASI